jgi:alcohol dehydrogenase class IV
MLDSAPAQAHASGNTSIIVTLGRKANFMNPFMFHAPSRIYFGEETSLTAPDLMKDIGGSRVLIITDDVLVKTGIIAPIIDSFKNDGSFEVTVFSDVPPDSDVSCVGTAAALGRKQSCDCIVSIGGGSVLDTAKAVAICLTFGGELEEYQGLNNLATKLIPHVAIPTTSGTGSEVSMVAMVKDSAERKKLMFGSRFIAPDTAILDPKLLVTLPPRLTAATGLDAVTHAIESFTSLSTVSVFTDLLCIDALRLLFKWLPIATKSGDNLEARANTLVASTMAGVAFTNTGVGVVHALAHATGGEFGTHHGMTNSVFLTHGMNFNMDAAGDRYAEIARQLKFSDSTNDEVAAKALVEKVEELARSVNLPRRLRDMGVPQLDGQGVEDLANIASTDPAIMFNPKETTVEDIIGIYERAY